MRFFAAFLALPLIEIGLFVTLGGALGLWLTLGFVLGSALLGVMLLRRAALGAQPRRPALMQMASGGFTMMAALLLILPGFLTSAIGALLLIPLVQRGIIALVGHRLAARGFGFAPTATASQNDVIDADYTVVPDMDPKQDTSLPPSKWASRD